MRVLVLDDTDMRHEVFSERHKSDEVWHAYTHEAAVDILSSSQRFDRVYLDHDLRAQESGHDTAKFIAERLMERLRPIMVVVHTTNPCEGDKMVKVLKDLGVSAQYEPFWV
jgi:CheY-like chemotaxis protein